MSAYADDLEQLRSRNPSPDPSRWEQAKRDAVNFLADWGDKALELGWPSDELFGLDPLAPFARYDKMGLVWAIQGRDMEGLTAEYADFGRTKFYRRRR